MNTSQTSRVAKALRSYPFVDRDWTYSRDIGDLNHIRYRSDYTGYNAPHRRLGRAMEALTTRRNFLGRRQGLRSRLLMAWVFLRPDNHRPDGVLDGGGVICHWEEAAEYLQLVQPTVGALIADLIEAHPDLPEVQAVTTEINRLMDAYSERVRSNPTEYGYEDQADYDRHHNDEA